MAAFTPWPTGGNGAPASPSSATRPPCSALQAFARPVGMASRREKASMAAALESFSTAGYALTSTRRASSGDANECLPARPI
jgi:hypothetical protein